MLKIMEVTLQRTKLELYKLEIKISIPGTPIKDPSGPAARGFNTGLISLFISYFQVPDKQEKSRNNQLLIFVNSADQKETHRCECSPVQLQEFADSEAGPVEESLSYLQLPHAKLA